MWSVEPLHPTTPKTAHLALLVRQELAAVGVSSLGSTLPRTRCLPGKTWVGTLLRAKVKEMGPREAFLRICMILVELRERGGAGGDEGLAILKGAGAQ